VARQLGQDLRLADNPHFLATHPGLDGYLANHPEVRTQLQPHPIALSTASTGMNEGKATAPIHWQY
jgi:hypothetical protein